MRSSEAKPLSALCPANIFVMWSETAKQASKIRWQRRHLVHVMIFFAMSVGLNSKIIAKPEFS